MNKKRWFKKTTSLLLALTLMFGFVAGVAQEGPKANAVKIGEIGNIGLKGVGFDARGEEYSDISNTKLYSDDPVCLMFKRKTGCRIPKGSYVRVMYKTDYEDLRAKGIYPWNVNKKYLKYYTQPITSSTSQLTFYWSKPWNPGKYAICLIIPCTNNAGTQKGYTWMTWGTRIYRYG